MVDHPMSEPRAEITARRAVPPSSQLMHSAQAGIRWESQLGQ